MKIELKKFGEFLISHPAGREAFLVIRAYFDIPKGESTEAIELDFDGVKVMAPSWLDEVVTGLREEYGNRVVFLPSNNASVKASIEAIA